MALVNNRFRAANALVGIALLFMPSASSSQQNSFSPLAREALQREAGSWVARGFEPVEDVRIGVLLERERDSLELRLDHGWEYLVLGVCDEDCTDLYLYLRDPQGTQVGLDVLSSGRPRIRLTPKSEGRYTLAVVMGKCNEAPCYYGLRLYRKATPP